MCITITNGQLDPLAPTLLGTGFMLSIRFYFHFTTTPQIFKVCQGNETNCAVDGNIDIQCIFDWLNQAIPLSFRVSKDVISPQTDPSFRADSIRREVRI